MAFSSPTNDPTWGDPKYYMESERTSRLEKSTLALSESVLILQLELSVALEKIKKLEETVELLKQLVIDDG